MAPILVSPQNPTGTPASSVTTVAVTPPSNAQWAAGSVPNKVTATKPAPTGEISGSLAFSSYPALSIADGSFRPLGGNAAKEIRFKLGKFATFETPGNYVVLPAHALFSMYSLAARKRDADVTNALERLLGKTGSHGFAIYTWSDQKIDFVIYEKRSDSPAENLLYNGTITVVQAAADFRERLNSVIAGYYWINSAKYVATASERDFLKALASRVLSEDIVERSLKDEPIPSPLPPPTGLQMK